jgi:thiosulfate/3-mercaptopyruvate sulfurtransferase
MDKISPIVDPKDLLRLKDQEEDFILIDASGGSKERYLTNHLDSAFFVDLETDLSAPTTNAANGGRHPLPQPKDFAHLLNNLGITKNSHVIIYDDKNSANAAARFWWMLRAVGHEKVQVLNGGFQAAVNIGFPVNNKIKTPKAVNDYVVNDWKLPQAKIEEVELASKTGSKIIVDVRDKNRFKGLTEPLDLIAGHIPGAINVPLTENLDEKGYFKDPAFLNKKYKEVFKNTKAENIIVHCGSGVTACHTLLALDYANLDMPKLYIGSWSEWSRADKKMVLATK